MDDATFAARANDLFRDVYRRGARRIPDARERTSPETTALLLHLAQAGPLTLTEMAAHMARAPSTLSAKVAALEERGLLARRPDAQDGRRILVWLSDAGRAALDDALQVLDDRRLRAAAARLNPARRAAVIAALDDLHRALASDDHRSEDPA